MIYDGSTPPRGPTTKITDTSSTLIYADRRKLHLTLYAVVHLLKEHGNSRSEISNVSISFSSGCNINFISNCLDLN